jgi:hypothetical protein
MKNITEIKDLKKYLTELLLTGRPGDRYARIEHAPNLSPEVILGIADNLIMRADDDSIKVRTSRLPRLDVVRETNQLWFTIQGRPYAMHYSIGARRANGCIEIHPRFGTATVHAINKTTTPAELRAIFASL